MKNIVYRGLIVFGFCMVEIVFILVFPLIRGTGWEMLLGFVIWFVTLGN